MFKNEYAVAIRAVALQDSLNQRRFLLNLTFKCHFKNPWEMKKKEVKVRVATYSLFI
jgi:hypothetical protein